MGQMNRVIGYNARDKKHGLTVNELLAFTQELMQSDIDGDTPVTVNVKMNSRLNSIVVDEAELFKGTRRKVED